jgi:hypothetical protein
MSPDLGLDAGKRTGIGPLPCAAIPSNRVFVTEQVRTQDVKLAEQCRVGSSLLQEVVTERDGLKQSFPHRRQPFCRGGIIGPRTDVVQRGQQERYAPDLFAVVRRKILDACVQEGFQPGTIRLSDLPNPSILQNREADEQSHKQQRDYQSNTWSRNPSHRMSSQTTG